MFKINVKNRIVGAATCRPPRAWIWVVGATLAVAQNAGIADFLSISWQNPCGF